MRLFLLYQTESFRCEKYQDNQSSRFRFIKCNACHLYRMMYLTQHPSDELLLRWVDLRNDYVDVRETDGWWK